MQFFSKICAQIAIIITVTCNGNNVRSKDKQFECPNWPRFIILGAQKAGTSSLFDALVEHPSMCEATVKDDDPFYYKKEVHYFDLSCRLKQGPEFYCSYFQGCDNHPKHYQHALQRGTAQNDFIHADITPDYLDYGIASLMKETFSPQARKNMKLIAVLREPTGRILSWYNHVKYAVEVEYCPEEGPHFCRRILRKSFINPPAYFLGDPLSGLRTKHAEIAQGDDLSEVLTFHEFALIDVMSIKKSKYIDILKEYYEVFGSKNVLVLNYDWMMEHQGKTLELISEFVGMDNIWNPESSMPYVNDNAFDGKMSMKDIECDAVDELHNFFQPYNEELYKLLHENESWHGQPYFRRFKKPECKKVSSDSYARIASGSAYNTVSISKSSKVPTTKSYKSTTKVPTTKSSKSTKSSEKRKSFTEM